MPKGATHSILHMRCIPISGTNRCRTYQQYHDAVAYEAQNRRILVEIITSEHAKPNPAWLNFAVSGRARSAIRQYIKNLNRHDAVVLGESLLQKALSSLLPKDVLLSDGIKEKYLTELNDKQTSFEEVLYNVAMGHTMPVYVAMHIAELAGSISASRSGSVPLKSMGTKAGIFILQSAATLFQAIPSVCCWLREKA